MEMGCICLHFEFYCSKLQLNLAKSLTVPFNYHSSQVVANVTSKTSVSSYALLTLFMKV